MGAVRTSALATLALALAGAPALAAPPEHQEIFGEIELEATGFAGSTTIRRPGPPCRLHRWHSDAAVGME